MGSFQETYNDPFCGAVRTLSKFRIRCGGGAGGNFVNST